MKKFNSIKDVIEYNKINGMHFFDEGAKRFFNSIIYPKVYKGNYFITSEKFDHNSPRLFTLRIAMDGGIIETIPKFQAFETEEEAVKYIQSLPDYLPEAYQFMNDCFNNGKTEEFINQALIEPVNSITADYSTDSFTGSCSWLCDHSKSIDDSVLKRIAESYRKKLDEHIEQA